MMSNRRYIAASRPKTSKKMSPQVKKRTVPKQEWNSYLTDADRYKMSKEEILRKKGLLLSKHNELHEESGHVAQQRSNIVRVQRMPGYSVPSKAAPCDYNGNEEVNALDLLGSDDDSFQQTTPALERKRKHVSSSAKKPQKKIEDRRVTSAGQSMGATAKRLAFGRGDTVSAVKTQQPRSPLNTVVEHGETDSHGCGESVHSGSIRGRSHSSASPVKTRHPSPQRRSPTPKHLFATSTEASRKLHSSPTTITTEKDEDLVYVADEVRSLFSELKFYEELSGRRSILDTREELEQMLKDDALLRPQDHKPVMRYLVNLVCQSLTYLLKSEVDLQDQTKHYEQLRAKYETLNTLLEPEERAIPRVSDLDSGEPSAMATTHRSVPAAPVQANAEAAAPTPGGIAFREDDLYPGIQWRDPEYARLVSQVSSTTPIAALAITAAATASGATTRSSPTTDQDQDYDQDHQPSSALRRLAQQYAQDEQYFVPGDADTDTAAYGYGRAEFGTNPVTALFASPSPAHLPLAAKQTATPARFTERLQQPAAGRNRTSAVPPTASTLAPATPVRNPASSTRQNPYNSVSSTCSTPPVGQLVKQYVQPTVHGQGTEAILSQMYQHISTPATCSSDAFAAYLPGTRRTATSGVESPAGAAMDVARTPASGQSRTYISANVKDESAAEAMDVNDSAFAADLSQMDAILERSRRIASQSAPVLSSLTTKTKVGGVLTSGEYSTINRLTENFAPVGGRTPADESLLSVATPAGNNASALLDTSGFSVSRAQEQYGRQQMAASQDSLLPPPPPPISAGTLGSNMPGTSPSDWLFNAYTQVSTPAARNQGTGLLLTPTRTTAEMITKPPTPAPQTFAHTAAKHRSSHTTPATADLYQQHQGQQGLSSRPALAGSTSQRTDSPDSISDATIDRLTQQFSGAVAVDDARRHSSHDVSLPTPPPRTAAPSVDALSQLKQWAMEGSQDNTSTPELYGATSLQTAQVRKVRLSGIPVAEQSARKQSVVTVKRTSATPPGSAQKVKIVVPSSLQEGASVIHPNSTLPSPSAAPVHPFAHKQVQYQRSSGPSSVSNANTPTSFAPLPLPGKVFDARYGSF